MKVLHRSQSLLILQERPVFHCIFGGLFIAPGLYYILVAILTQKQDDQLWELLFAGGFCIIIGFISICMALVVTCRFDQTLGKLILKQQGLFGTKVIERRLNEIQDVQVEVSTTAGSPTCYRVTIVLVSSKRLPLTPDYANEWTNKQKIDCASKNFSIYMTNES